MAQNVSPDFMPIPTNLLGPAYDQVTQTSDLVSARIADASATADRLYATAEQSIAALKGLVIPDAGAIPQAPVLTANLNIDTNLPAIPANSFGTVVGPNIGTSPALGTPAGLEDIIIPDFVSSISSLNIPSPPSLQATTDLPTAPAIDTNIALPDSPNVVIPNMPVIEDITIPDFVFPEIPEFDALAPEFAGTALNNILQWQPAEYQTEIMDEVLDKIRGMWSGTFGLPPGVIDAMVQRAAEREDVITNRAVDAVDDEYSLRGFTMPSGMQAARADQARRDNVTKQLGLNRDITIQAAQWQIENVRAAIQNAIAAEQFLNSVFENNAGRVFQAAQLQLQMQLEIYNAQVNLYNAKQQGYAVAAQVYRTKIDALVSQIQVFRAEVDIQIARGTLNETKARIYATQLEGVQAQVSVYEAQLRGAQTRTDINKSLIDMYRATVEAYATRISIDKIKIDAYSAQVGAEGTKAGIIESEARAYSSLIQGKSTQADIDVKRADIVLQTNRNLIEAFTANLDAEKTKMQYQVSAIQAASAAYEADTQRFVAQAGAEQAKAQVQISANEANLRTTVAIYEASVKSYETQLNTLIQRAQLSLDSIKSAGGLASTLAAGAMAAVHVGANLSGGASVGASSSLGENLSYSYGESASESYSYEGT